MTEKLIAGLEKLNLKLTETQIEKLEKYIQMVLEFNKTYNLMKAADADELAVNHILDSLAAVDPVSNIINDLSKKTQRQVLDIADIGSGGGCPGIPLAIVFDMHNFTLVERMEKRCNFLSDVVNNLKLENVTIACKAVDTVERQCFDLEVFRAFHPFDLKITNLLLRMLRKGGYLAAYKAREEKIIAEMDSVKILVKDYKKIKLTVPFLEDHERNLVVIENK